MKHRLSITLDKETVLKLKKLIKTDTNFRNQSHLIEVAVKKLIGEKKCL